MFRLTLLCLALLILLVSPPSAAAQRPGELDRGFAGDGTTTRDISTHLTAHMARPSAVLVQPDGKVLVVGDATSGSDPVRSESDVAVVRHDPNGTVDGSWGSG